MDPDYLTKLEEKFSDYYLELHRIDDKSPVTIDIEDVDVDIGVIIKVEKSLKKKRIKRFFTKSPAFSF